MPYYLDPYAGWVAALSSTATASANIHIATDPWGRWVETRPIGYTSTAVTWNAWNTVYATTGGTTYPTWQAWVRGALDPPYHRDPRFAQLPARTNDDRMREAERNVARRHDATRRARAALEENMTDQQKLDYHEKQHFDVEVSGKTYRIMSGTHGNVHEVVTLPDGREIFVRQFCIPSRISSMPEADVHLTQKLMLECGMEEDFHRIANITEFPLAEADRLVHDARLALAEIVA